MRTGKIMRSTLFPSTNIPAYFVRLLLFLACTAFSVNALANAQIVTPSADSTLSGSEQTFSWTIDSADVERVWLYVGTTAGGLDIANSGDLGKDTEYDVIGIPVDGSTIHARLWYYSASRWFYVDSTYKAANLDVEVSTPAIQSPANNSELPGASVDFKWSANNTLVNYWWLYLGTKQGGYDLYNSATALRSQTSVTVDELPTDGTSVHARLWFRTTADGWKYTDSVYRTKSGPDDPDDPDPDPESAELDMARLLMQGSFGPTVDDIAKGLELGGPAQWIDAQMALPAQLHLPLVRDILRERFPNEKGRQRGRYIAFWERSLRADDQLRQRVAFALSQIFVISDKAGPLRELGNKVTNYYDVLVRNSFGNYRQLLEEVTLNTAMGRYLSMLGNEKPDSKMGIRADENYAREMMQLFSIGLVGLNIDGSERAGDATYTQADVENLARALTGWNWDDGRWRSKPGYRPADLDTLEKPMVAFADYHDTDEKVFLGNVLPAGQTAEQDLAMVLDILFNHPNVGPFIGEQLIKRLVTSNPSPGYISRVARAFNDNGAGVRGDMSAVVRAILLDDEARNLTTRDRTDFGKLREPLLRYAHVWRTFNAKGEFALNLFHQTVVPQIVPLSAPSVFNYYSPGFSPQGAIADAGLVAPEFQINSEANSNTVNTTLMRAVVKDELRDLSIPLDLTLETQLLGRSTKALLDHLDRLLTADKLNSKSRQILTEYIDANKGRVDANRLVRDVIGLVVTSTEFAIQR